MRSLVVATVAALALAGCTDDDADPGEGATPDDGSGRSMTLGSAEDPRAELEAAVKAYSDAFLTGSFDLAFTLLSERCRQEIGQDQFTQVVEEAGELYGTALPFAGFSSDIDEGNAEVTYTYEIAAINQVDEPWIRETDGWRNDDC